MRQYTQIRSLQNHSQVFMDCRDDGVHHSMFNHSFCFNVLYSLVVVRPVRFAVEKDGEYWLCMCKQTKHRPFCDGTHKEQHIQDAIIKKPST